MAESRRVQLTTLSCDAPSSCNNAASGVPQETEERSDRPADTDTVRLVLTLFEPDERSFPEFSYSQLVDNKINQTVDEVPLSRLEEEGKREDGEVAAIARRLEEKYGGKPKKKKDRIQDLIDIGYGYDEEDSFIDNSEAYDEFVPASITTKFGGFYVNSGVLQFRQASDAEADDLTAEEATLEPTKKRKLNGRQDKPKKKQCRAAEDMKSSMDPESSALSKIGPDNEMKIKKKKKVVRTLSVTSMLKKFQREKDRERQKMEKANQETAANIMDETTLPLFPADAGGGGGSGLTDPLLSLIGSTNDHALIQAASTVDFDIDLDSLLDVSEETSSPKSLPQPATEIQPIQSKPDDQTQLNIFSDARTETPNPKNNSQPTPHPEQVQLLPEAHQCCPLPEGLPPGLEESIRKLTVAAKTSEGESKLKFFNPDINSILLDIELQCREQGGPTRSKVYTHLSSFLPCSRDTLLKRVKKLLTTHAEEPSGVVEDPMQKLREAIGRSMPGQIASFHENCQAYEQVKTSNDSQESGVQTLSIPGVQKEDISPSLCQTNICQQLLLSLQDRATEEDNVEEKGGKKAGPRKWFKWNEEIRECLGHVLREKMDKYKKEGKGGQEIEKHLKTLLDNEIKPLWPKGWMQSRVLIRQSRNVLGLFASLPVKKAKSEKKQSSISGASTLSDGCNSLQGTQPLTGELPSGTDHVLIEGSNTSNSVSLGVVQKEAAALNKGEVELDVGLATCAESDAHSLLDLLADQALAQKQPLAVTQELLVEAVAKYKNSFQHWSFGASIKSPPPPPPPPQSSPVSLPVSRGHQVVLPQLLPAGDTRHEDAAQVNIISNNDGDVIIIE